MIEIDKSKAKSMFDFVRDMLSDNFENIAVYRLEWRRKNGEPLSSISGGAMLSSARIEDILYGKGKALFFKDNAIGFMCLECNDNGEVNENREATKWRAIGNNYSKEYDISNAVLIKNNYKMRPTKDYVDYCCAKMADIELAKDVNRDANKTPIVIETDADTVLSAKNLFKQLRTNEPIILKNKKRKMDMPTTVLNTGAPYIVDKLEDDYHNYEARILMVLGLDNYVEDKAERVQSAEVNAQDEYIISGFRASLRERQIACDKINKMFGLDLEIVYVKDQQIENNETETEQDEQQEVSENE